MRGLQIFCMAGVIGTAAALAGEARTATYNETDFGEFPDGFASASAGGLALGALDGGLNTVSGALDGECVAPFNECFYSSGDVVDGQDSFLVTVPDGYRLNTVAITSSVKEPLTGLRYGLTVREDAGDGGIPHDGGLIDKLYFGGSGGTTATSSLDAGTYSFSVWGQGADTTGDFSLDYDLSLGVFLESAFATSVVEVSPGDPAPNIPHYSDPNDMLGQPDYEPLAETGAYSLGFGGTATVEFGDVFLTGDGTSSPDLYIGEVVTPEPVRVSVSIDGNTFYEVGTASSAATFLDIDVPLETIFPNIEDRQSFSYVRLEDITPLESLGIWGADIDAVGAASAREKVVEPEPQILERTVVYLNFVSDIPRQFGYEDTILGSQFKESEGITQGANVDPEVQRQLRDAVQIIFNSAANGAGVDVSVVLTPPPDGHDVVTVYFKDEVFSNNVGITYGSAYDIVEGGPDEAGIDRFNLRKDGNVAVFGIPGSEIKEAGEILTLEHVSSTIAHEAAHSFGLIHTLPKESLAAIMRKNEGDESAFASSVQPTDRPRLPALNWTTNSSFHLTQYVNGAADEGLESGSWDTGVREKFGAIFDFSGILGVADEWLLGFSDESIDSNGLGGKFSLLSLNNRIDPFGLFSFDLYSDQSWTIFGRSEGSSLIDIFLEGSVLEEIASNSVYGANNESLRLFLYDENMETEYVGDVGFSSSLLYTVSSNGSLASVPLPLSIFVYILSVISFGPFYINKKQKAAQKKVKEKVGDQADDQQVRSSRICNVPWERPSY